MNINATNNRIQQTHKAELTNCIQGLFIITLN